MKKILIIKHGSLGDIVSATSVLHDIKVHYKSHKIFILSSKKYKNFFEESDFIDEILIDDRKDFFSIFIIIRNILRFKFDLIIDLQNSQRTNFYALLIKIFSRVDISGTGIFSTFRYKNNIKNIPSVIDGLSNQIELLGIKTRRKPNLDWLERKFCEFNNIDNEKYIIINPGCSKTNLQKRWSAKNYSKLCSYLVSKNILPILIGTNEDADVINMIVHKEKKAINLLNKSPLALVYQLSKKALGAVSNDTGPAHLIAASGCKLHLILSSFSNIKTVIPQGENVSFTQKENIENILVEEIIDSVEKIFKI